MSKVYGMHMIALHPGVKAEDFEKFVMEEVYPVSNFEGWKYHLLKGDRGEREGNYLGMFEFESVELRDRLFPSRGEMSEEIQQFFAAQAGVFEKWATFATPMDATSTDSTDYVVVGK